MNVDTLRVYLNDHLAGSIAGEETARAAMDGAPEPVRVYLARFITELHTERATLRAVMSRLELPPNPLKTALAWLGEKAGRVKLRRTGPEQAELTRFMRLEGLCLGVEGKGSMWRVLHALAPSDSRLAGFDFERLDAQARAQHGELERLRLLVSRDAFRSSAPAPEAAAVPARQS